jgi:dTDP-4-dehydrorhamnose reductase
MTGSGLSTLLLTGGSGQVGRALRQAPPEGFEVVAPTRAELDLADPASVRRWVGARPWAAIVNAGAWTAVDAAETQASEAWAANALGPAALARASGEAGIPLVHISTDYVFDGGLDRPYREDDPVGPTSVYGASKAAGEVAVAALNPRHVILRTAWVFSPWGANFVRTMLRLAETRDALSVVADQHGCPTSALDIAAAVGTVCTRLSGNEAPSGVFHFAGAGETTWFGLASRVFETAAAAGRKTPVLTPIATADWPTPVRRPVNSRLDTAAFTRTFGQSPRPWTETTDEVMDRLLASAEGEGDAT